MERVKIFLIIFTVLLITASIANGQPPAAKVVVAKVYEKEIVRTNQMVGIVDFDKQSGISAEVSGLIEQLFIIEGAVVDKGAVLAKLNKLAGDNGIGRLDIVENRYVGMKSRGCYETPGGSIMLKAHRAIESITLDREVAHLKDELMPKYASLIYNGYWWSPERELMQQMIDASQQTVNGEVRLKLYKGSVSVVGRKSESNSLFDENIATFEDDAGAYNQQDAEGFIKLNALRLRIAANRKG